MPASLAFGDYFEVVFIVIVLNKTYGTDHRSPTIDQKPVHNKDIQRREKSTQTPAHKNRLKTDRHVQMSTFRSPHSTNQRRF